MVGAVLPVMFRSWQPSSNEALVDFLSQRQSTRESPVRPESGIVQMRHGVEGIQAEPVAREGELGE